MVGVYTYAVRAPREGALQLGDALPQGFEVHVELYEEGFCERVSLSEGVHRRQEEPQRVGGLAVVGPALQVLYKHPGRDIEAKGDEGVHLRPNQHCSRLEEEAGKMKYRG